MTSFVKPEYALKRAEELIDHGQKHDALLQTLHGLITSKRYRPWQKTLERIVFKYVENLCVDMKKGRLAKDGLIQYRIMCQQVNVSSLEEVIKLFVHLSTEKAEQARSHAQALGEALDVDDLEVGKRLEDLISMFSHVSGKKGKDRSNRELVTPWCKFPGLITTEIPSVKFQMDLPSVISWEKNSVSKYNYRCNFSRKSVGNYRKKFY